MGIRSAVRRIALSVVPWQGILGLNYHRIGDGRRSMFDRGLWSATESGFYQQVEWLKANFDIISPGQIADARKTKRGRHVVITFDDGFQDNYTAAFSVLKSLNAPAAFFVSTGFVDRNELPWWDKIAWMVRTSKRSSFNLPDYLPAPVTVDEPDRERAVRSLLRVYKKLPADKTAAFLEAVAESTGSQGDWGKDIDMSRLWMTWDMLREMNSNGMTIGGHGVSHSILSRMSHARQLAEIEGCQRRIVDELKVPMSTFAYPVGSRDAFNSDTRDCLRRCGVTTAFSYYGGFRKASEWDDFDICRQPIEQDTSFEEFKSIVLYPSKT